MLASYAPPIKSTRHMQYTLILKNIFYIYYYYYLCFFTVYWMLFTYFALYQAPSNCSRFAKQTNVMQYIGTTFNK